MDELAWTLFGILALSGIVWLFFRYTREGHWIRGAAYAIRYRMRNGRWDDTF